MNAGLRIERKPKSSKSIMSMFVCSHPTILGVQFVCGFGEFGLFYFLIRS